MNDFTKDELETLVLWIADIPDNEDWPEDCDRTKYYRNLARKIQSLIDNYDECDHSNLDTNICYKCGFGVLK